MVQKNEGRTDFYGSGISPSQWTGRSDQQSLARWAEEEMEHEKMSYVEEFPSVLWAYQTTPRSTTGVTPISLVFGSEAAVTTEIQGQALSITLFDPQDNEDLLNTNSMFLEEKREEARTRYNLYKSRIQEAFNRKVKKMEFQVGDLRLRQADALQDIGKLEPAWEGPYKVVRVLRGGSYELENQDEKRLLRPWQVSHLKKYYV